MTLITLLLLYLNYKSIQLLNIIYLIEFYLILLSIICLLSIYYIIFKVKLVKYHFDKECSLIFKNSIIILLSLYIIYLYLLYNGIIFNYIKQFNLLNTIYNDELSNKFIIEDNNKISVRENEIKKKILENINNNGFFSNLYYLDSCLKCKKINHNEYLYYYKNLCQIAS
jgi:hypothetical protein